MLREERVAATDSVTTDLTVRTHTELSLLHKNNDTTAPISPPDRAHRKRLHCLIVLNLP
jgi:hypothetical protein